ncbi:hypothetical protein SAMN05444162_2114 [Paenibacillaceae bacterium GAS479]|nr:hypothetical protein SAMN05444162_2114 [Paenibacillaceae bacterium GAS479]
MKKILLHESSNNAECRIPSNMETGEPFLGELILGIMPQTADAG